MGWSVPPQPPLRAVAAAGQPCLGTVGDALDEGSDFFVRRCGWRPGRRLRHLDVRRVDRVEVLAADGNTDEVLRRMWGDRLAAG